MTSSLPWVEEQKEKSRSNRAGRINDPLSSTHLIVLIFSLHNQQICEAVGVVLGHCPDGLRAGRHARLEIVWSDAPAQCRVS